MKRLVDIGVSAAVILLTLPLWGLIALAILGTSGSPVFYRGRRVGFHAQPLEILKFRTMVNAPDRDPTGHVADTDARITPIGRWLRAWKLDEWPQWWLVLRGDMSIIGPRPMTPAEVQTWPPLVAAEVLAVRPGLVDWATLRFHAEGRELAAAADPVAYYRDVIRPLKLALALAYARGTPAAQDPRILWQAIRLLVASRLLRRPVAPTLPAVSPIPLTAFSSEQGHA